jgi:cobalt/nickel transport protein
MLMDKLLRNLIIALAILIVVVPIGLLAVGTAYGEWGIEDLQGLVGFIPAGLASIAGLWNAPVPDYALPSLGESFLALSISYWLSAVIGVILCVGAIFLIGRVLTRRSAVENK